MSPGRGVRVSAIWLMAMPGVRAVSQLIWKVELFVYLMTRRQLTLYGDMRNAELLEHDLPNYVLNCRRQYFIAVYKVNSHANFSATDGPDVQVMQAYDTWNRSQGSAQIIDIDFFRYAL